MVSRQYSNYVYLGKWLKHMETCVSWFTWTLWMMERYIKYHEENCQIILMTRSWSRHETKWHLFTWFLLSLVPTSSSYLVSWLCSCDVLIVAILATVFVGFGVVLCCSLTLYLSIKCIVWCFLFMLLLVVVCVCLFACLFVCLFVCLLVCVLAFFLACSLVRLACFFVSLLFCLFVCLFVHWFTILYIYIYTTCLSCVLSLPSPSFVYASRRSCCFPCDVCAILTCPKHVQRWLRSHIWLSGPWKPDDMVRVHKVPSCKDFYPPTFQRVTYCFCTCSFESISAISSCAGLCEPLFGT